MIIPDELNRVTEITVEYLNEIYKTATSPYYRKERLTAGGKSNWKIKRPLLSDEIDTSSQLYDELKRKGKIIRGHGVSERKFQAYYLGVSEGTIENIIMNKNKHVDSADKETLQNEKNFVCKQRINPLLNRLGYSPKNYKYNEAIHMGSTSETNPNCKPDYQIYPSNIKRGLDNIDEKYLNTAMIIIEAKYELGDKNRNWYGQAVTYARRLCAPYIVLADRYYIVLYSSNNNFITSEQLLKYKWEDLENKENFKVLADLIGQSRFTYDNEIKSYKII